MYKYQIYYEGNLELWSDTKLTEDKIPDLAYDIIHGDARTRLDHYASEDNFEIIDEEEVEE